MFSWSKPSAAQLLGEYRRLPPLQPCDKSPRVQLLEDIVKALQEENERLQQRGGTTSTYSSYSSRPPSLQQPAPAPPVPPVRTVTVVWGETAGLSPFSHSQKIREQAAAVSSGRVRIQWEEHSKSPCADPCVFFFRKGERVSPSEMERIEKFCTGTRNFVVFMVNEPDPAAKDRAVLEKYVQERLGASIAAVELACMTFDETKIYPLDQGLNKGTLDALVRFISA